MKTLIIGNGEVGSALKEVLSKVYEASVYDIRDESILSKHEILHVCIPYSDNFVDIVREYIKAVEPVYTVIHTSVPVGTCDKIGKVVHSPVRGVHPHMVDGLLAYIKYIGYPHFMSSMAGNVAEYFEKAGIKTKLVEDTKTTELMKLLELSRYGVYIAFAKEQDNICRHFGLNYLDIVTEYENTRNDGIVKVGNPELRQPILYPFEGYVGGHCTTEDMEILLAQVEGHLLSLACQIDKATNIWANCNIYKTAVIGKGCNVGSFTEIGHRVKIGNNVRIGAHCFIPEGVEIEDDVFIAPRVSFSNDKYPPSSKEHWGKILVRRGVAIGMGSTILPDVEIGENALIGAGSVVTTDVPAGEKWFGVPARGHGFRKGELDAV